MCATMSVALAPVPGAAAWRPAMEPSGLPGPWVGAARCGAWRCDAVFLCSDDAGLKDRLQAPRAAGPSLPQNWERAGGPPLRSMLGTRARTTVLGTTVLGVTIVA